MVASEDTADRFLALTVIYLRRMKIRKMKTAIDKLYLNTCLRRVDDAERALKLKSLK